MFWQTRRDREAAESAKEREAFLRRLREVLEPYSETPEPATAPLPTASQRTPAAEQRRPIFGVAVGCLGAAAGEP